MRLPQTAPSLGDLLRELNPEQLARLVQLDSPGRNLTQDGRYRHWDTLRNLRPPGDLSLREWWLLIKIARSSAARSAPLTSTSHQSFSYVITDEMLELLHIIDQGAAGEIALSEEVIGDDSSRRRYLFSSLIEEAIRSSQLEGASTTRKVAKEMLRSGRQPQDRSERMILNNYLAMEFVRDRATQPLTTQMVLDLHRILTEDTLDNPDAAGRFQRPDEERVGVYQDLDNTKLHTPPPAEELPERMEAMCRFANGGAPDESFMHPVLRAILLHLWLAYDHPFEDGNGRTARALFYWSMKRSDYWLVEYLSISRVLRDAPVRYGRAFLYTETDGFDATYFILNQLDVIRRSIQELHRYLRRKMEEVRYAEQFIHGSERFNTRQLALLRHALRHPSWQYTAQSHARSHNVSAQSARNDLKALVDEGLLTARSSAHGRVVYSPADNIGEKVKT